MLDGEKDVAGLGRHAAFAFRTGGFGLAGGWGGKSTIRTVASSLPLRPSSKVISAEIDASPTPAYRPSISDE